MDAKGTMKLDQLKASMDRRAAHSSKGQTGAVVALLLALIGGLIIAIFHTNTVGPVANTVKNVTTNETAGYDANLGGGAGALLGQYTLIYVAAGMIGFFVLIMNAAT